MPELLRIVDEHVALLLTIGLLWIGGGMAYFAWRRAQAPRVRPAFAPEEVRFVETYASGCSHRDLLTRLSGASKALSVTVTREWLIIELVAPFRWFLPIGFGDLEHAVPRSGITSIEASSAAGRDSLRLQFRGADGAPRTFELIVRRRQELVAALQDA